MGFLQNWKVAKEVAKFSISETTDKVAEREVFEP
jgi:hypothetical protein